MLDGSVDFTPAAVNKVTVRFWMKNITNRKNNLSYYA